ncbi:MAG: hypothetical protein P4L76_15070 [Beijerinckiaceae bacterium]|nr:hypothetical protein [Beijerinckiaceae bacterium]
MNKRLLALALCGGFTASMMVSAPVAEAAPGGCLKYGAAGAVAGHYAGHHAVKGALAGCAVGIWKRHQYNKEQREHQGAPTPGQGT